jgi:Tol biopolymer transport system component/DNA-binding winged helix-turn-helix (wHTH) protein
MTESSFPYFQFAEFRLELRRSLLFSEVTTQGLTANIPFRMPKRSFHLLTCLLEQAGTVVTKQEIFERVWLDQPVEDGNLSQQIYLLRRLLEVDPSKPALILTIPGIGYLFTEKALLVSQPSELEGGFPLGEMPAEDSGSSHSLSHPSPEQARGLFFRLWRPRFLWPILCFPRRFRWGLLVAAVSALVLIPLGSLLSRVSPSLQPVLTPITSFPGTESHPRFSKDGKLIAFTADPDGKGDQDIYIKLVNLGEPVRVTSHLSDEGPLAWSPDGTQLAFLRASADPKLPSPVLILPILGGQERVIGYSTGGLDWSPREKSIAITTYLEEEDVNAIALLSLEGQPPKILTRSDPPLSTFDEALRFSPQGDRLAFIRWRSGASADLYLLTIASGSLQRLTTDQVRINSLQWGPDGSQLFFVSERNGPFQLWKIPTAGGGPSLIPNAPLEISQFDLSPIANQLAYTQILNDSTIAVVPLSGPPALRAPSAPFPFHCQIDSSREDHSPHISPDGSQMVFMSDRSGWPELWTSTLDCQKLTQLTFLRENGVGTPRWSPDGRRIAFDRHLNGSSEIFSIEVATGIITQHTNHPASDFLPSWSNDGTALYFCSNRSGQSEIWKLQLASMTLTAVTHNSGFESQESSDGTRLFFTRAKQLWIKDLRTGQESLFPLPTGVHLERDWRFVDQHLFYRSAIPATNGLIQRTDHVSQTVTPVLSLPGAPLRHVPGLSISPDLKWAAISYFRHRLGDLILLENWN